MKQPTTHKMLLRNLAVIAISLTILLAGCSDTIVQEPNNIIGVTDLPGSVMLTSQTDVNNLRGLIRIQGSLGIGPSSEEDPILDLAPLSDLEYVGAGLTVDDNRELTTLAGLENLNYCNYSLTLRDNPEIENLEGLGRMEGISRLRISPTWPN